MSQVDDIVVYNDKCLTITYKNYGDEERNYGELFDFLGDFDIVTGSEIGRDVIVMSGLIFYFTHQDEANLSRNGHVTLSEVCNLTDYIDKNNPEHISFLKWYF